VIGAAGTLALTRLMTDLLFEVKPFDPIAMLASFVPGWRATGRPGCRPSNLRRVGQSRACPTPEDEPG